MLAPPWQKINARRHTCHWWQDLAKSRLSAMTTFFIILVLVAGVAATLSAIVHDDRGQLSPPRSRAADPTFTPPSVLR